MVEFKPVVFRVAGRKFGVDIEYVQGIEKEQSVVPVPNTVEYINGIINLRGEVIPVYSLKKKFAIEGEENPNPQYIIVWIKDERIALEVDGVDEIHDVSEEMIHAVPSIIGGGDTKYIHSVISSDKDLIIIINIDELLTESELKQMDSLVQSV